MLDIPFISPELRDGDVGTITIAERSFRIALETTENPRAPAIVGMMVIGESQIGDERGSRVIRVIGLDQAPPGLRDRDMGSVLPRTDSPAIRLAALNVEERLAREVEDAAQMPGDVAVAGL